MQLIIVSETRSSCRSDYKYIKSAIDYFYHFMGQKLTPLYARTKSELINKEKEIIKAKTRYKGVSKVIIVTDFDDVTNPLNKKIAIYCKEHGYDLVWMNRTIEEVFLNKIVHKEKGKEADNYLKRANKILSTISTLFDEDPLMRNPSSNLLVILDKYLKRK